MYTIHYVTRKGAHVMKRIPDLASTAAELERLFQARIEATAYNENRLEVGAVWYNGGKLTWACQTD